MAFCLLAKGPILPGIACGVRTGYGGEIRTK
jgi:hypothetical protein